MPTSGRLAIRSVSCGCAVVHPLAARPYLESSTNVAAFAVLFCVEGGGQSGHMHRLHRAGA